MINDAHFQKLPDGRLLDRRFRYRRGDRVRVISEPYIGHTGVVDSLVGQLQERAQLVTMPGYNIQLDNGAWVTLSWNVVEAM